MSVVAGGEQGSADGVGTAASFFRPSSIALVSVAGLALIVSIMGDWFLRVHADCERNERAPPLLCRRTATITLSAAST